MLNSRPIKFNKREVSIPWFIVGTPAIDFKATIEAVRAAVVANKTATE